MKLYDTMEPEVCKENGQAPDALTVEETSLGKAWEELVNRITGKEYTLSEWRYTLAALYIAVDYALNQLNN